MSRRWAAIAAGAALAFATPVFGAQAQDRTAEPAGIRFAGSPITPGFWSWARKKPANATEIAAGCREGLAIQLANGRYLTLRLGASAATVIDQGHCAFNVGTQIERCELTVTDTPGETKKGFMETRYSHEPDGTMKMTVTGTVTEGPGAPKTETFEVYPVRCPDDTVHDLLTKAFPAK